MFGYENFERCYYFEDGIYVITDSIAYDQVVSFYMDKDSLLDDCITTGEHEKQGLTEKEYREKYSDEETGMGDILLDMDMESVRELVEEMFVMDGPIEYFSVVESGGDAFHNVREEVERIAEENDITLDENFEDDIKTN